MSSKNHSHYFSNISNAVLVNPIVAHVNGNIVYTENEPERYGLKLLLENISRGAFHDAAERSNPPRCHPHTRTAIRAEIMEWIQAPNSMRKLILWMYGPAGAGKTAIVQSIAEECKRQGLLAASFFFGRTAAGRNDTSRFVATIAYQISRSIPQVREHLISAIEQDPTIFSRTLATQMEVLLIEPLKSLPPSSRPIFVITDGVDECGPNRDSHTVLLNSLETLISELRHIPLIFLLASRPEHEIREAFNGDLLSPLVKLLTLDNNYKPDKDIRLYLNSTFQQIRDKNFRLGSHLPSAWPTKTDVDLLVSKASGQFIFASTVMSFISSSRYYPPKRLDMILGLLALGNETPFAQLDALYHFILSSVADLSKVLEILTILVLADYGELLLPMTINATEAFLGFAIGPVLVDMHALVYVPSTDRYGQDQGQKLRVYHVSLYDFLTDRSRSHERCIDPTQGYIMLSRCWLRLMANYPHIPAPLNLHECVDCFVIQCKKLGPSNCEILDDLASFSLTALLHKIRNIKDLYEPFWNDFFAIAKKLACARVGIFPRLRDEFDTFVLERLSKYPSTLRDLIPTILVHGNSHGTLVRNDTIQDIFRLSLYALNPSETKLVDSRRLDSTLLDLYNVNFPINGCGKIFAALFEDRSRAGQFFVDSGSYAILAKQVTRAVRPMPGRVEFVPNGPCQCVFDSDTSHPTIYIPGEALVNDWLRDIIANASADFELAMLLRERMLQYDDKKFGSGHYKIMRISLQYVKRCGLPYLKHTHFPKTNRCIVCVEYRGASTVVDKLDSLVPRVSFFGSARIYIRDRLRFLRK